MIDGTESVFLVNRSVNELVALGALALAVGMVGYIYLGYPIVVTILRYFFYRPLRKADILPRISMIIAAHNEEKDIAAKIENSLSLDYPRDRFEIIVASDCSTDGTDRIVRGYQHRGVILHRQNERNGKTRVQHRAVSDSTGEILVFSDATTIYARDALLKIVRAFADPDVGCVAGQLIYVKDKNSAIGQGCRSYWSYEKFIKENESELGSLIGVSGCCYAVRRSCHTRLASEMIDDFAIAIEIHQLGLRTVYEPEAVTIEETNAKGKDEMRMRVRVIEQTMSVLSRYRKVLNPFRHGLFAFQMISHKVLRYTVPAWMLVALVAGCVLAAYGPIYRILLGAQLAGYGLALAGWLIERAKRSPGILAIPYYFMLVNIATVLAFLKFISGRKHVVWQPNRSPRPDTLLIEQ